MELYTVEYDHPDAVTLISDLQQIYVERYGEEDFTPVDPGQFAPPGGYFVIGHVDGVPVACGGWRAHDEPVAPLRPGDAEIKRMYVVDSARGKGLARKLLAHLEQSALAAGRTRMVLETGTKQPEAIGLYESCGYQAFDRFGPYREHPDSLCFDKVLQR